MRLLRHSVFALLALGLVAGAAAGADLDKLRQKLAREPDPANRAKITVEIGDELLKPPPPKTKAPPHGGGRAPPAEIPEGGPQGLRRPRRDGPRRPPQAQGLQASG